MIELHPTGVVAPAVRAGTLSVLQQNGAKSIPLTTSSLTRDTKVQTNRTPRLRALLVGEDAETLADDNAECPTKPPEQERALAHPRTSRMECRSPMMAGFVSLRLWT